MKRSLNLKTKISILSALAIVPTLVFGGSADAQTKRMDATYIGAGVSVGVTKAGTTPDSSTLGGTIQGRIPVPNTPVSVRGAVEFSDKTSTIMPIVTYDLPLNQNTNVYVGGGYGFHEQKGQGTPFGTQSSPVVTAGVESALGQSIVVFSDAKVGIKPYQNSSAPSVSLQVGAGYRF